MFGFQVYWFCFMLHKEVRSFTLYCKQYRLEHGFIQFALELGKTHEK